MEIIQRLKALIIFLYITGKWLGLTAWWVTFASLVWSDGFTIFLVSLREGELPVGIIMVIFLAVPLVILSVVEWVLFGKLTWSYKSFQKTDQ